MSFGDPEIMGVPAIKITQTATSLAGDFWGGFAAMLVVLPSSVAFGIVVYTALGPEYAGRGAIAGLLGAAALGVVAPIVGRTVGLTSTPCAPAAAVLSATIAGLLSGIAGPPVDASSVPVMIALVGLFSACLQALYGLMGGGRLIKFIPYQVVTGYLWSVGLIIVLGQLPKFSWPSKRRFSLAGADLTGPLEMAGRHRWNRHDLSDAFGSKDHSEIASDDPWPFCRRARLFRSLPSFARTFGFAQQLSGDWTSSSRCFVV
jgi:uncharacterized membrane protein YvlD (DUF360 family)